MLLQKKSLVLGTALTLAGVLAVSRHPITPPSTLLPPAPTLTANNGAVYQAQFISQAVDQFNHAAAITELANGDRLAVWFSGSREGADDVVIAQARFEQQSQQWLPAQPLLTRVALINDQQRFTGKLGNPVIATAPDGKVWLFFVAATYFGWGSSTINVMTSSDNGFTWSAAKRLQLTPFFNLSTLVRNAPQFYQDGSIGLPVYRESMGKFPQWLRISANGELLDQSRAHFGRSSLQPAVVSFDQTLIMLLRSADSKTKRVLSVSSHNAGDQWNAPSKTEIANPNSGLSAVWFDAQHMLVAANDVEKGRHQLSLYLVDKSAEQWQKITVIEKTEMANDQLRAPFEQAITVMEQALAANQQNNPSLNSAAYIDALKRDNDRICGENKGCEFYYDYPYLYRDSRDQFHLVYSWNKSFIKHITFNREWVAQQL